MNSPNVHKDGGQGLVIHCAAIPEGLEASPAKPDLSVEINSSESFNSKASNLSALVSKLFNQ